MEVTTAQPLAATPETPPPQQDLSPDFLPPLNPGIQTLGEQKQINELGSKADATIPFSLVPHATEKMNPDGPNPKYPRLPSAGSAP